MNRKEFEEKLEKHVFHSGGGGLYFKNNYFETLGLENKTLQKIAGDLKNDINSGMEDETYDTQEVEEMREIISMETKTDKGCFYFFTAYLSGIEVSFPELCGSVAGALIKKNMFDEAAELIGLNIIDEDEMLAWDS